ncbi:MAG: hypothetical protein ACP5HS_14945, partial [Anaerolineae bacterium]
LYQVLSLLLGLNLMPMGRSMLRPYTTSIHDSIAHLLWGTKHVVRRRHVHRRLRRPPLIGHNMSRVDDTIHR